MQQLGESTGGPLRAGKVKFVFSFLEDPRNYAVRPSGIKWSIDI